LEGNDGAQPYNVRTKKIPDARDVSHDETIGHPIDLTYALMLILRRSDVNLIKKRVAKSVESVSAYGLLGLLP
jgi:hypothetical protein